MEYKELALESGIENWGRVPALGCEPTFISDLADAVIESLPYVGAMAVSNLEARQVLNTIFLDVNLFSIFLGGYLVLLCFSFPILFCSRLGLAVGLTTKLRLTYLKNKNS